MVSGLEQRTFELRQRGTAEAVAFQGRGLQTGRFGSESSGWAAGSPRLTPFNQENLFISP